MIFLWLCIFCSTLIYILFKIREKFQANLSGIILINYFIATILGFITSNNINKTKTILHSEWLAIAILIGVLFVIMFFLIGISTIKTGITVTSIATRMSMIIPIFFSMFLFDENISTLKIFKIILTLIAVILAIYNKADKNVKLTFAFFPIILFIGSGSVDTLVKFAQHKFVPNSEVSLFSSTLFGISFITSFFLLFIKNQKKELFSCATILIGSLLGIVNFGSLYFLIKSLNNSGLDSSLIFGINNLAIVCFSLLTGFFVFKEKLTRINWAGIFLSIICIILLINN